MLLHNSVAFGEIPLSCMFREKLLPTSMLLLLLFRDSRLRLRDKMVDRHGASTTSSSSFSVD